MITNFKIFEKRNFSMWSALDNAIVSQSISKFNELIKLKPTPDEVNGIIGSKEKNCDLLLMASEYADYNNDDLYFVIELTKLGADWFIKNSDGKYFLDYGNDNQNKQLEKLFPKLYKEYIFRKQSEKYNL